MRIEKVIGAILICILVSMVTFWVVSPNKFRTSMMKPEVQIEYVTGTVVKIVSTAPTIVDNSRVVGKGVLVGKPTYVVHVATDKGLYVVEIAPGEWRKPQTIASLSTVIVEGTRVEFPLMYETWGRETEPYFSSTESGPSIGRIPPYELKVLSIK